MCYSLVQEMKKKRVSSFILPTQSCCRVDVNISCNIREHSKSSLTTESRLTYHQLQAELSLNVMLRSMLGTLFIKHMHMPLITNSKAHTSLDLTHMLDRSQACTVNYTHTHPHAQLHTCRCSPMYCMHVLTTRSHKHASWPASNLLPTGFPPCWSIIHQSNLQ